jgi:DNA polymerase III epsilon subunit family exonuclease
MPPYPNLVSDSAMLQETLELLLHSGGRAASTAIADCVFKISNLDEELASLLVADLVRDDLRFKVLDGHTVELQNNCIETGPLDELEFVVVDVEATGAKMPPNRIIELGAYRIKKGRIVDEFVTLVNPELPIPRFVMTLTRISNDMVKSAPVFADVAPRWLEFVGDAVLVAHNAPFDTNFLNHEISRVYPGHRMVNSHLCTVTLSRRTVPGLANYRLDTIADHFAIPIFERHRAGSDALATAEIFIRLLSTLNENGVRSLATARTFHLLQEQVEPTPLIPGFEGFDRFRSSFQKSPAHDERNNQKR